MFGDRRRRYGQYYGQYCELFEHGGVAARPCERDVFIVGEADDGELAGVVPPAGAF